MKHANVLKSCLWLIRSGSASASSSSKEKKSYLIESECFFFINPVMNCVCRRWHPPGLWILTIGKHASLSQEVCQRLETEKCLLQHIFNLDGRRNFPGWLFKRKRQGIDLDIELGHGPAISQHGLCSTWADGWVKASYWLFNNKPLGCHFMPLVDGHCRLMWFDSFLG